MKRSNRSGFTLIELMLVISIVGLLVAMLLPAIGGVRNRVWEAQVTMEIAHLGSGLVEFKMEKGHYPPSLFHLCENQAGWDAHAADMAFVRGCWPSFDFARDRDLNRDGDSADVIVLDGRETMVFFLGGVRFGEKCVGFSKDPADPFATPTTGAVGVRYYDFPDRLSDLDGDTFPEFLDPLPGQRAPYVYLRAPYTSADAAACGMVSAYQSAPGVFWNDSRYQIVSAGVDGLHGQGGLYDPKAQNGGLDETRAAEFDNICDFSNGLLGE